MRTGIKPFAVVMVWLALCWPSFAFSFQIGDIQLSSAIKQPLRGNVVVIGLPADARLDDIEVIGSLAVQNVEAKWLNQRVNARGEATLQLTTPAPLNTAQQSLFLTVATREDIRTRSFDFVLAERLPDQPQQSPSVADDITSRSVTESSAENRSAPVPTQQPSPAVRWPNQIRFKPRDTLWKVSQELAFQHNLNIYAVIQAIVQRNPKLLSNGIKSVKTGDRLTIPAKAKVKRLDPIAAREWLNIMLQDSVAQPAESPNSAAIEPTAQQSTQPLPQQPVQKPVQQSVQSQVAASLSVQAPVDLSSLQLGIAKPAVSIAPVMQPDEPIAPKPLASIATEPKRQPSLQLAQQSVQSQVATSEAVQVPTNSPAPQSGVAKPAVLSESHANSDPEVLSAAADVAASLSLSEMRLQQQQQFEQMDARVAREIAEELSPIPLPKVEPALNDTMINPAVALTDDIEEASHDVQSLLAETIESDGASGQTQVIQEAGVWPSSWPKQWTDLWPSHWPQIWLMYTMLGLLLLAVLVIAWLCLLLNRVKRSPPLAPLAALPVLREYAAEEKEQALAPEPEPESERDMPQEPLVRELKPVATKPRIKVPLDDEPVVAAKAKPKALLQ